ncbi:MAG TPA: antitoxin Xre/MbcA/ParS toxin-binding domain-containing protein [Thermoanaerobaculia bacterium]|nr:antitoxin Xre/MbcA/ParS toxin-binding domain-containing protein [Thermoanaerobaculia bacterium]
MAYMAPGASLVVDVFGGAKTFAVKVRTLRDLHRSIGEGIRYRGFEALLDRYGMTAAEIAPVLDVPSRTLARRKKEGRFHADESDRLLRLGRIAALAEEVLGDSRKAASWLKRPNRAIANETPLQQLDTDLGCRLVEDILLRVAHGIYS